MKAWFKDGVVYVMIGLNCYGVLPHRQESINEWVHEFTESTLNRVLYEMKEPNSQFLLKTNDSRCLPVWASHLITSMVTESHIESFTGTITTYTGEQFGNLILKAGVSVILKEMLE